MEKPLCLNFRLITANVLGVREFRTVAVTGLPLNINIQIP